MRYVPLDLATAKLTIFVDGSFANNRDLSSQIDFVIALVNEKKADGAEADGNGNGAAYNLRGNSTGLPPSVRE